MGALKYLGYAAFFVFWVVAGLYLSFPWDIATENLFAIAKAKTGVTLTGKGVEPSWITGVAADELSVTPKDGKATIVLKDVRVRAKLLALITGKGGAEIAASIGGGRVEADVVVDSESAEVEAEVKGVALESIPQLADAGAPLQGKLNLDGELLWHQKEPKKTKGKIVAEAKGFVLGKGVKLGMFPLPRDINLGDVKLELPIVDGTVNLAGQKIQGVDVEAHLDGNLILMQPTMASTLNLDVRLKPLPALLDSDPIIKALLRNVESFRGPDGFFRTELKGPLNNLRTPYGGFLPPR